MILIVCVVFTLLLCWYVLSPHLQGESFEHGASMGSGLAGLSDQRERCIQVLRDLELDFETKKIVEADYRTMKGQVSAELAVILEQMDQAGSSSSPRTGVGDESVAG